MDSAKVLDQLAPILPALSGRTILVTGASGLVGASLIRIILQLNERYDARMRVIAAVRNLNRAQSLFFGDGGCGTSDDQARCSIELLPGDVVDGFAFEEDVDYVVHAASPSHPLAFASSPVDVIEANVLGVRNMLDFALAHKARLLYVSTGEVYGPNPEGMEAIPEDYVGRIDPLDPRSCYPESKRCAENLCVCYAKQLKADVVIARLCYVFGPLITSENSRADAQFLRNARAGEDIVLKSSGSQRRTYCYADDAASALLYLLARGECAQAYNVANRNSIVTVREYAEALADAAGVEVRVELPSEVEKAGFSKSSSSVLSASKLEQLGWVPQVAFEEAIASLLE